MNRNFIFFNIASGGYLPSSGNPGEKLNEYKLVSFAHPPTYGPVVGSSQLKSADIVSSGCDVYLIVCYEGSMYAINPHKVYEVSQLAAPRVMNANTIYFKKV